VLEPPIAATANEQPRLRPVPPMHAPIVVSAA
jgi:hypothetical protein